LVLVKKRAEIAGLHKVAHKVAQKANDGIKDDLATIDRALALCGYQDDPKGIAPRGKYKQLFGCNELKLITRDRLREGPADDETIAVWIMERKGWDADDALRADVLSPCRATFLPQAFDMFGSPNERSAAPLPHPVWGWHLCAMHCLASRQRAPRPSVLGSSSRPAIAAMIARQVRLSPCAFAIEFHMVSSCADQNCKAGIKTLKKTRHLDHGFDNRKMQHLTDI
jgi:hypothetical protein